MAGIRTRNRLKAVAVEKVSAPGIYADGGGLSLIVTDTGAKKWELRIAIGGRRRQLGLGVYPGVSLEDARSKATQIRIGASDGRDVISEQRQAERIAAAAPRSITFRAAFDGYFEMKEQQLSNDKHKAQWRSTMQAYVFPAIGKRPVGEVTAAEVIDILKPIWNTKRETARRVLQRMRAVFEAAIVRGERDKASPTIGVATVLGSRNRKLRTSSGHALCRRPSVRHAPPGARRLGRNAPRLRVPHPYGISQRGGPPRHLGRDSTSMPRCGPCPQSA